MVEPQPGEGLVYAGSSSLNWDGIWEADSLRLEDRGVIKISLSIRGPSRDGLRAILILPDASGGPP